MEKMKQKMVLKIPGFSQQLFDKVTDMGQVGWSETYWKKQKNLSGSSCKKMQIKD